MKNLTILKFRTSLVAAVLAIAPLSPALHSQDVGMLAKVDVPFSFETGSGHRFSAGVYTVRMENEHVLQIKGVTDTGLVMITVNDNAAPVVSGKAKFHRYGNRYFLSEISVSGHSRRIEFRQSTAEREQRIEAGETGPATLEVAMLDASR